MSEFRARYKSSLCIELHYEASLQLSDLALFWLRLLESVKLFSSNPVISIKLVDIFVYFLGVFTYKFVKHMIIIENWLSK